MKTIYKILALSLLFVSLGCKNSENEVDNNTQENSDNRIIVTKAQFKENDMALGSIEEKTFPLGIKVNGMIDVPPENKAVVNSIIGGYIKTILLLVGDVVKKGQPLVTIENPEFVSMQQKYMEVKEQLNYLKSEYQRQNTLFKEDIISKKVYLKAESEYKTATATYNGLKKQLRLLNINPTRVEQGNITSVVNIYAPISGSITKVNVSKGSFVSPSNSILEIIDNDHIHIELSVFEKDIMRVEKGQKIIFSIPEASTTNYEAEVYLVGTALDDNRTIKVHGHPKNESHNFLTGMFVNAEIMIDEKTSNALPLTALIETNGDYYVLVLDEEINDNYYFNQLKVNVGRIHNGFIETNLSKANNKVLINGAYSLIGNE